MSLSTLTQRHLVASQSLAVDSSGPDVKSSLQEIASYLSFSRICYFVRREHSQHFSLLAMCCNCLASCSLEVDCVQLFELCCVCSAHAKQQPHASAFFSQACSQKWRVLCRAGIACIVPPDGWEPPFALERGTNGQSAESFKFMIRKQLTSHLCMRVANTGKATRRAPSR